MAAAGPGSNPGGSNPEGTNPGGLKSPVVPGTLRVLDVVTISCCCLVCIRGNWAGKGLASAGRFLRCSGGFGVLRKVLGWLEGFGLGWAEGFVLSEGLVEGFWGAQKSLG